MAKFINIAGDKERLRLINLDLVTTIEVWGASGDRTLFSFAAVLPPDTHDSEAVQVTEESTLHINEITRRMKSEMYSV